MTIDRIDRLPLSPEPEDTGGNRPTVGTRVGNFVIVKNTLPSQHLRTKLINTMAKEVCRTVGVLVGYLFIYNLEPYRESMKL